MKAVPALFTYYERRGETLHRSFGGVGGRKGRRASRVFEGRQ
jgi:hypothetical protein